jgi:hypothetical protein
VAEWFKVPVLKTDVFNYTVGSNPTLPALCVVIILLISLKLHITLSIFIIYVYFKNFEYTPIIKYQYMVKNNLFYYILMLALSCLVLIFMLNLFIIKYQSLLQNDNSSQSTSKFNISLTGSGNFFFKNDTILKKEIIILIILKFFILLSSINNINKIKLVEVIKLFFFSIILTQFNLIVNSRNLILILRRIRKRKKRYNFIILNWMFNYILSNFIFIFSTKLYHNTQNQAEFLRKLSLVLCIMIFVQFFYFNWKLLIIYNLYYFINFFIFFIIQCFIFNINTFIMISAKLLHGRSRIRTYD